MPLTLNSTIAGLSSQQNPKQTQGDISSTAQVLPSASAIPSRRESAVTITIDAQINLPLNTTPLPVIPFNDAIAVGQTAEKALNEINTALAKIRQTTLQAVAGQNTVINLNALNEQLLRLKNEINAVVEHHHYKNTPVLKNGFSQSFPVDAQHTNTINLTLTDSSTHNLGVSATTARDLPDIAPPSSTVKIPGSPITTPLNTFSVTRQQQAPQHHEKTLHKTEPIDNHTLIPPAPVIHYQITLSPLENKTLKQDKHILPFELAQAWPVQTRPITHSVLTESGLKKSNPEFHLSLKNSPHFTLASYELYRFTQTLLPDHSLQTTKEHTITHFIGDDQIFTANAVPSQFDPLQKTDRYRHPTLSLENKPGSDLSTRIVNNNAVPAIITDLKNTPTTFSNVQYAENTINPNPLHTLNQNPPKPLIPSLIQPIGQLDVNTLKPLTWKISATQSTVINFSDYPISKGDRISLAIQGHTKAQGIVSNSDIETL
ncbi:MAG TPA: hypothetical protein EYN95_02855, partial [Methylococcaceae bacterium]|nr:hypothetical protein [Methylococcaceae bacterium]